MTRQTCLLALTAWLAAVGMAEAQSNHWGEYWTGSGPGLSLFSYDGYGLIGGTMATAGASGLYGYASNASGSSWGVFGDAWAPQGVGVFGLGHSATGLSIGVQGDTISTTGIAVLGQAEATKGANFGVYGLTWSRQGVGVYGSAPFPAAAGYFAGNTVVAAPGSLSFGSMTRQMLNLWGPSIYGIGVQPWVMYFRTDGGTAQNGFAWFKGGTHADNPYDPGAGGVMMMKLDQNGLTVNGTFISSSDAAAKQDRAPVDVQHVLEQVGQLPIEEWSYQDDPRVRHVGPMAQEFRSAFGLGADERHIAMVDADGVALAAIQALKQLASTQQAQIGELQTRLAAQENRIETLLAAQRTR